MSRLARLRAVPWLLVFEAARAAQRHFVDVTSAADRRRVSEILKRTKGMPAMLTEAEKRDLSRIARKVDLKALGAELTPHVLSARSRRR